MRGRAGAVGRDAAAGAPTARRAGQAGRGSLRRPGRAALGAVLGGAASTAPSTARRGDALTSRPRRRGRGERPVRRRLVSPAAPEVARSGSAPRSTTCGPATRPGASPGRASTRPVPARAPGRRAGGVPPLVHHLRTVSLERRRHSRGVGFYASGRVRATLHGLGRGDARAAGAPGPWRGPRPRCSSTGTVDATDDAANALRRPGRPDDVRVRPHRRQRAVRGVRVHPAQPRDHWAFCGHQEGLRHFVRYGWRELRNPSPDFDLWWYWFTYLDPAAEQVNPVVHYLAEGRHRRSRHGAPRAAGAGRLPAPAPTGARAGSACSPGSTATASSTTPWWPTSAS